MLSPRASPPPAGVPVPPVQPGEPRARPARVTGTGPRARDPRGRARPGPAHAPSARSHWLLRSKPRVAIGWRPPRDTPPRSRPRRSRPRAGLGGDRGREVPTRREPAPRAGNPTLRAGNCHRESASGTGHWAPGTGHRESDTGNRVPDTGHWTLRTGEPSGNREPNIRPRDWHWASKTEHRTSLPGTGIGDRALVAPAGPSGQGEAPGEAGPSPGPAPSRPVPSRRGHRRSPGPGPGAALPEAGCRDGHLQHQELGPAGPEEAPEQNGHQDHRQRLHRRHQQRDPGRAVPGHQGVHPQPQGGPEDHQEPHQDRDEAGRPLPQRAVQPRGAAGHGALPQEGSHLGHDGRQLPPDRLHLRPQGHVQRADRVPGPAAPGSQRAPDGQVALAHQPRLQPLCGLRVPVGAVRPGRALPHPPAEDLRGGQQDAGGGEHLSWAAPGSRTLPPARPKMRCLLWPSPGSPSPPPPPPPPLQCSLVFSSFLQEIEPLDFVSPLPRVCKPLPALG